MINLLLFRQVNIVITALLALLLLTFSCQSDKRSSEDRALNNVKARLSAVEELMVQNAYEADVVIDSILDALKILKDDSLYAATVKAKGETQIYLGNFEKYDSCLQTVLDLEFKGDELIHAETMIALAEQNNYSGNPTEALQLTRQATELLDKTSETHHKLRYKIALVEGLSYFSISQIDSMKLRMETALELAEYLEKESNVLFVYSYLGYMYSELKEYQTAENYLLKSYTIAKNIENYDALTANLVSLSGTSIGMENYQKAIEYCTQALKVENEIMHAEGKLSYIYNNRSEAYLKIGEDKAALLDAEQAYHFAQKMGDKQQEINALGNLAAVKRVQNDFSQAINYSNSAIETIEQGGGDLNLYDKFYKLLTELYVDANDYKQALYYKQLSESIRDSIERNKRYMAVHEVEVKYETAKKEQALVLAQQTIKSHRRQIASLLVTGFLLALLFVSYYIFRKKQRLTQIELLQKNEAAAQAKLKMMESFASKKPLELHEIYVQEELSDKDKIVNDKLTEDANSLVIPQDKINELVAKIDQLFKVEKLYLQKDLTINFVAEQIGTNRSYLSQILNQVLSTNFTALLNLYRVEEAKRLMKNQVNSGDGNNFNLDLISDASGFNTVSVFHKNFKKETGLTPGQYRKSLEKKKINHDK